MRNPAVLCLLLIYTTSQVGSLLIYYYRPVIHAISIQRQQRRMREENASTKEIIMSRQAYYSRRHEEKEIILNGVMHDVQKISFIGDKVFLRLLEDKNETNLLKSFTRFLNLFQQPHQSKKWPTQFWSWLFKVYKVDSNTGFCLISIRSVITRVERNNQFLNALSIAPPGQPPERMA